MWFNEFLDLQGTVKHIAKYATRALGAVLSEFKRTAILFDCFKQLFDSMVTPVLLYGAGIWGTENRQAINTVQNKFFFLEVQTTASNIATRGKTGWISSYSCQKLSEIVEQIMSLACEPAD